MPSSLGPPKVLRALLCVLHKKNICPRSSDVQCQGCTPETKSCWFLRGPGHYSLGGVVSCTVPWVDIWVSTGGPDSRVDTTKEHEDRQGDGTEGKFIAYAELFQIAALRGFLLI